MRIMRKQRAGAVVATVLAALALALVGPAAAHAETIDTSQDASLTIHKRDGAPGTTPGDGTLISSPPGNGVNGVGFTLRRVADGGVPIDLSSNDGQVQAAAAAADWDGTDFTGTRFTAEEVTDGTTATVGGEAGVLEFPDLEFGLYLVEETTVPPGVTPAAPFLVTVPFSNGTSWLYNVHVYPKNAVPTEPQKTVSAEDVVQIGDQVEWTVSSQLQGPYGSFVVTDQLDTLLDYTAGSETVTVAGDTLVEGTDYTFTEAGGLLTWTFTDPAGLAALNAAAGDWLVITFQTTANGVGSITNVANVNGVNTNDPDEPGGATLKFGSINVLKTDAADNTPLDGAVFEVYLDVNNNKEWDSGDEQITIDGQDTWTTDDGEVLIEGLRYSRFVNGDTVAVNADGYNGYLLKEIQAPDGYSLLADAIFFEIDDDSTDLTRELEVENMEINAGFTLPLTGGTGIAFFTTLGVLLIGSGAAIYLLIAARRRRDDAEAAARRGAIAG